MPQQRTAAITVETKWISVDEAEEITGRSRWSWRKDAYAGKIGSSKVGRLLRLRLSDVLKVMEAGYRPPRSEQQQPERVRG